MVEIAAHGWRATFDPGLGGSVTSLTWCGHEILRTATGDASPLDAACFPLVPYANRIAHGLFTIDAIQHKLPANFGDHPHPLHGVGWQSQWEVAEHSPEHLMMSHRHVGDDRWPWTYHAEQRVTLESGLCRIEVQLQNLSDDPMPGGLGFHPYFHCDATTSLKAEASGVWLTDATMLPTTPDAPTAFGDWAQGAPVAGTTLIDNAFADWSGVATIRQPWGALRLRADGARHFHLYRPADAPFFCFEPVDHLPDAINRGGMRLLKPAEAMTLSMTLSPVQQA